MLASRHRPTFPAADWTLTILIGAGVAILRWLTLDFDNDYFMHVAWAAEIRLGALPVRDFVEPGFALQTLVSYTLMKLFGYQLAAEGIAACAFIGAGAACTYAICRQLGVNRGVAAAAGILAALTYPRLYAYPKAFVYPAALLALTIHVNRPRRGTLVLLALMTAVAFLFRHDHGVYIALPALGAVWLTGGENWHRRLKASGTYAGLALLFTLPWTAWIALSGYHEQYIRALSDQGVNAATRFSVPEHGLHIDASAPLIALDPPPYPKVTIRWSGTSTDAIRRERETRYRLVRIDDENYSLQDFTPDNVNALLRDPLIEDTRGIDRLTGRVPAGRFAWAAHRLMWRLPALRMRILPGLLTEANALPWLTSATFALPWLLLVAIAVHARSRRGELDTTTIALLAAAALAIIGYQKLVRGSPDSRIGDIASLTWIMVAYLVTRGWTLKGAGRRPARIAICLLVAVTAVSAVAYGRVLTRLEAVGVVGPRSAARRAGHVFGRYNQHPLEVFAPADAAGLANLTRWLHECTFPGQRVAVVGFEPEINVWSERGFAGGLAYFNLGWRSDPRDQGIALTRWRTQNVPFVLLMTTEERSFQNDYRNLYAWVAGRYRPVRTSTFGGNKEVTVLLDRSAAVRSTHAATGLPCLTGSPPADHPSRAE